MKILDKKGEGVLNFEAFALGFAPFLLRTQQEFGTHEEAVPTAQDGEEHLKTLFSSLDSSNSGFLTKSALKAALQVVFSFIHYPGISKRKFREFQGFHTGEN